MTDLPRFSVIIPTYCRRAAVERALAALTRQSYSPAAYEVIVSIDGSEDGTRELLNQFTAQFAVRSVWRANRGRAAALNTGIGLATGEILILLDDDMEPAPGFLAGHAQAHAAERRWGVMGAAPIRLAADTPPLVAEYVGPKFNQHLQRLSEPGHRLSLRDFYSGNFSIRRELLLETGLFDESFKLYGNEDLELAFRFRQAKVVLTYAPEALAYQHYTKDFAALARDTMAKGQTAVLLASKHPATIAELQLSQFSHYTWRWRGVRALLLTISRWWSWPPQGVIGLAGWLERRRVKSLALYYRLALDYLYWMGVQKALKQNIQAGRGLISLDGQVRS